MNDSNAACADVALDAVLCYAEMAPAGSASDVRSTAESLAGDMIAKGFSARPAVAAKAEAALLKFMEVSCDTSASDIIQSLLRDHQQGMPRHVA